MMTSRISTAWVVMPQVAALLMVGEHDPGFHQAAEVMAAKLPDARSERIANGGHILNIEVADHFNLLVAAFLAELA